MSEAMELTQREFDQIGSYVREHLGTWIRDISPPTAIVQLDPAYIERIVRVEEELKSQRELMKHGFDAMEKRFEQVDKRFEQVDKRFEEMRTDSNIRFEEMRSDMNTRFEAVDKRFAETRADMKAGFDAMRADMKESFEVSRSHTNHWMSLLTIVLLVFGVAMTLVPVLVG
ncbi:MAG TPA: hypothetical protein VKA06_10870 [Spirochaetia bacterium]|nr:hypothetical protein [Spirochaetia bacterium]